MKTAPSLADIAEKAGTAISTVSLALRNDPRVALPKRQHIQLIAAEMGYQANPLVARLMFELRKSRKQKYVATLAVINVSTMPPATYNKISNMAAWHQGLHQRARQLGYNLDHFWLHDPDYHPNRVERILRAKNIQGVVFHGVMVASDLEPCKAIASRFPSVVMGVHLREPPLNFIINDHYFSAFHACRQLRKLGYRRIGIVLDRWLDDVLEHRYVAGYFASHQQSEKFLPVLYLNEPLANVFPTDSPRLEGKDKFAEWIEQHRPDACICINSYIVDWIRDLGIGIPHEMGFALLDLPRELNGIVAGMEPRSIATGMKAIDVLVGQINRGEEGLPSFQTGTMIESQWMPGPTVRDEQPPSPPQPSKRSRSRAGSP
ncbi:MAG: LacI family DNA-binding transcriptional regulator [Opitutaceae bacterium]|jgi:LacI family transcriptional regulator